MGLLLTFTAGLVLWIVIWALNHSGLDAALLALAITVAGTGVRIAVSRMPGRRG